MGWLVWIGALLAGGGIVALLAIALKARALLQVSDAEAHAALRRLAALNAGALALGMLGAAVLVTGLILSR